MPEVPDFNLLTCPVPRTPLDLIVMGHGGGGQLSADLLRRVILPGLANSATAPRSCGARAKVEEHVAAPAPLEDQATITLDGLSGASGRIAFTTDSYVVHPLFFPGGDIGKLAIHGTVNDLAVGGARPICISAALILEEGLAIDDLRRIVESMGAACAEAGVSLVTGDTKVVDRGRGDQVFITTAGIGVVPPGRNLSIAAARPGDKILVSGTIGDHGVAVMSVREGLDFETALESDTAPLGQLTEVLFAAVPSVAIRCMRDPTRGGVASTLNELAEASRVGVMIEEAAWPVRREVRAACEMLGLDPLYVANEGKLIAVVATEHAEQLLAAMREHPLGRNAALVGEVSAAHPGMVIQRTLIGGQRVVSMLSGEQLPRIC